MRFDNETGECLSVDYETYEATQEENRNEIEKLKRIIEDLKDENYQLKEELEEEKDNSKFYKIICESQKDSNDKLFDRIFKTKKDSNVAPNESK